MSGPRLRTALLAAAVLLPLVVLSIHPLCNLIFGCGCHPVWSGGVAHCNIHLPGVPHCPFCTGEPVRLYWVAALALLPPLGACALLIRRGARPWRVVIAGVIAYLAGMSIAGLIAALSAHYPRWLGIPL